MSGGLTVRLPLKGHRLIRLRFRSLCDQWLLLSVSEATIQRLVSLTYHQFDLMV